ncbi:MAG: hypothetical protein ABIR11_01035 [Candidatus Limnocylindrales bacterium]
MPSVALKPQTVDCGLWYTSPAAEASKTVLAGKGVLHTLIVSNSNVAARYIWVFDSLTATGTPLLAPIAVPLSGSAVVSLQVSIPFTVGLTIASSSTQATFTAGTADMQITAGYARRAP